MKRGRALGLAGLCVAVYYLLRPGRSLATAVQDVEGWGTGTIVLTAQQQAMKGAIESMFTAAGMSWAAPAAVANAWAESRLDPSAVGDQGLSVGLFQLHERGAGAGLSVTERKNPETNIARIIQVCAQTPAFMTTKGATHADVTKAFAEQVEKCALCFAGGPAGLERVGHLRGLYGDGIANMAAT